MKKLIIAAVAAFSIVTVSPAVVGATSGSSISFDECGSYGWVEYIQTTKKNAVERSYTSFQGEALGIKVWRNGELVTDTLGQSCTNDL